MQTLKLGPLAFLYHRRASVAGVILALPALVVWIVSLGVGEFPLSPVEVLRVLTGGGEKLERTVVIEWRLARSLVALAVGAALGLSGAITQRIARNGLASPDILGINQGATVAAVAVLVTGGASGALGAYVGVPLAALVGGLVTGGAIWALSRRGNVDMFRLVLVGIGVNAFLHVLVTYMLAATDLNTAAQAKVWMVGSLNGRTFEQLWPTLAVLVVCSLVLLRISVHLPVLELGEDAAQALGVPLKAVNATLLVVAVALAAVTVSAVGPVGFVAFVAPQITARLAGTGAPPLAASAAMGALLVVAADLAARGAFGWEVPVGIITSVIGGPFLIWLLFTQSRTYK
ncbi:FecCD family ABC transporter permease [Corynebacterium diphtheriae]